MSESPRILLIGLQEMLVEAVRTFVELGYTCLVFVPREQWRLVERHKLDELADTMCLDTIASDEAFARAEAFSPDFLLTIVFGERVPPRFIALAKRCAMNVHPASLPECRSGNPWFWPLRNGATSSGLAVHKLVHRWDAGDVLHIQRFNLTSLDTQGTYAERARLATRPCILALHEVLQQPEIVATPQPKSPYYPTLKLRDIVIDWNLPAREVECLIRACNPNHYAQTLFRNVVIEIIEAGLTQVPIGATPVEAGRFAVPGELMLRRGQLFCAASDQFLRLDIVSVPRKGVFSGGRMAGLFQLRQGECLTSLADAPRFQPLLDTW